MIEETGMRRALPFAMLATLWGLTAIAQDSVTITSDPADQSRPVSTLLNQLRKQNKIPVTYEDPRYANSADIEDVTSKVARNLSPSDEKFAPRILVPKGKTMSFVYSQHELSAPAGVESTISRMLGEYEALGGPKFAVIRDGTRYHVVPRQLSNAKGDRISQDSILDTVIGIPSGERDDAQLLDEICNQIQKQTGYRIDIGPGAINMHDKPRIQGIEGQTARAAIERVWDSESSPGSFVWDLYYDPSDKSYGLSFSYVGPAGPAVK
jgi:hypothetical protein